MPKKTQPSKFSGELNTPIQSKFIPEPTILSDESVRRKEQSEERTRVTGEKTKKLLKLLEHYKIDFVEPDVWMKLACCLMDDFVPGFQVQLDIKSSGRDAVWSQERLALLWLASRNKFKIISKYTNKSYQCCYQCDYGRDGENV